MNIFYICGLGLALVGGVVTALLGWAVSILPVPIFLAAFLYLILAVGAAFPLFIATMLVSVGRAESRDR